jgi:hypothetical protein
MMLSALVENCGPSMQTMVLSVKSCVPEPFFSSAFLTSFSNHATSF